MSGRTTGRFLAWLLGLVGLVWLVAVGVAFVQPRLRPLHDPTLVPCGPPITPGAVADAASATGAGGTSWPRLVETLGDPATSGLPRWPALIDAPPAAFDIDGDGVDELVVEGNDTLVYVFGATTGRALAVLPTNCPLGWTIERVLNGVEVAVLEPGEPPSLVVTNPAAFVAVWKFSPAESTTDQFVFHKAWERRMDACFPNPAMDAKATLADVDADGRLEILVQTEEVGFYALGADGKVRWHHCWAGGNSAPVVGDLDGDGTLEAVFASDSGFISVLDGATGNPRWTFDARDPRYGVSPTSIPVSPTIAELDGRPPREILFTARHAPRDDPASFRSFHMALFAIRQNPTTWQSELVWMRQPDWAHPLSYTRLVVADVDADESPDIFGMDWNTIGHRPGHWEALGPAHAFRLTAGGADVWVREVDSWWSNKDVALVDADGDGDLELWVNGAQSHSDGLCRLSARTGAHEAFVAAAPWKLMRGPVVADLRHDGSTQFVYPVAPDGTPEARGALLILDFGSPTQEPRRNPA